MSIVLRPVVVLAVLLGLAAEAGAGEPLRNTAERLSDHGELARDRRDGRDDTRDLAWLEQLSRRFDAARAEGDPQGLRTVDTHLRRLVEDELAESAAEEARAAQEVRRSRRELRSDRRELRRDRRSDAPLRVRADDHHDRRRDRRDLRDDRADRAAEARQREETRRIAEELSGLLGSYDEPSLERRRALLDDLLRLARVERVRDEQERREDRRELREDRRETREDRRQPY